MEGNASIDPTTSLADEPRQVAPGIWRAEEELVPGILLALHLVADGERGVLIDTGVAGSFATVERLIEAAGLVPEQIGLVVNTHAHHDHIGSNRRVKERTGALLAAPAGARAWIEDHDRHVREFTSHHPHVLQPSEAELDEIRETLDGPTRVDLVVSEGLEIRLGDGLRLCALELPGHIDAEIGFYEESTGSLIVADAIPRLDWGLFHGHGPPAVLRSTLRRLRALVCAESVQRACLAHYSVLDEAGFLAAIQAAFDFVDRIDDELRRELRQAGGGGLALPEAWEGVCEAFERDREFRGLAMVAAHMDELAGSGVVERIGPEVYRLIETRESSSERSGP